MASFIDRANIEHHEQLLERTTDKAERQRIVNLLAKNGGKYRRRS